MRLNRLWMLSSLALLACAGGRKNAETPLDPGKEKLIDALTMFVEAVQGERYTKALDYLTPEERNKMTDGSGLVSTPVQKQLRALRLSTLASKPGVHLEKGKLAGIHAWLPNIERTTPGDAPISDSTAPLIQ
ncbi:MAG: hypothetical protein ABIW76_17045 [Fibrobacteria bacterium]